VIPNDSLATGALPPATYVQTQVPASSLVAYDLGPVALNDSSEGLDVQVWTCSVSGDDIVIESDTHAQSVLFTAAGTSQVSLTFDQNGAPFVAFVQAGEAKFWWYDTLINDYTITTLPAGSLTPRATLDERRIPNLGNGDIILAYVLDGDLVYRQQRDRYQTEYLLRENVGGVLSQIDRTNVLRLGFDIVPTVDAGTPVITNPAPDGDVTEAYSHQYAISGGLPPYVFTVVSGALPTGLSLSVSGLLSGTPEGGSYTFTVQVSDQTGATYQLVEEVDVSVLALAGDAPNAATSVAYSYAYTATGGTVPYAFDLTAGSLPPGVTLNASSGVISGTPTTAGAYTWTVRVTDAVSSVATVSDGASVIDDLSITNAAPNGVVSVAYSHTYAAAGGVAPYTWALSGSLPTGFSFNTSTGELSGTTVATGTYPVTVTVTDAEAETDVLADSFAVASSAPFLIRLPDDTVIEFTYATVEFRDAPGESVEFRETPDD
jgi:hypothetical protein